MLAGVRTKIDLIDGDLEEREDRSLERRRFAGHREDRSVVRGIRRTIEQPRARHTLNRLGETIDDLGSPPLAHVGHTLDHHAGACNTTGPLPATFGRNSLTPEEFCPIITPTFLIPDV